MTLDPKATAALALHRFGLGPRAGSIAAHRLRSARRAARRTRRADVGRIAGTRPDDQRRRPSRASVRISRRASGPPDRRQARSRDASAPMGMAEPDKAMATAPTADADAAKPEPASVGRQIFSREAKARFDAALGAEIGFVERLVWFWSNHFCVSADKMPSMAGAYEREAIRPHVLGRFADMLLAVESHPAMLFYLDNAALDRPEFGRRHQPQPGPERKSGARDPRTAYARRAHRLHAGRRHQLRQGADRLDADRRPAIPSTAASSSSTAHARAGRADRARQELSGQPASSRAAPCSPISRAIRRPRRMSRPSSRGISSPTSRRRRWSSGSPRDVPRHRRRSQGGGEGAGRRAGSLGRRSAPSSSGRPNG